MYYSTIGTTVNSTINDLTRSRNDHFAAGVSYLLLIYGFQFGSGF